MLYAVKHITDNIFFFQEDSALVHISILHATQSNCCDALDFLSPELCRQQPRTERIDYKIQRVTQQREYESWVKKRLKKSSSDWLNSGNALIQYLSEKMRFSCFPVLPGSAEAHVTWGGIVKRLLIAYFIDNISAKNIKKRSRVSKL